MKANKNTSFLKILASLVGVAGVSALINVPAFALTNLTRYTTGTIHSQADNTAPEMQEVPPPGEQMPPGQQMPPGEGVPPGQQMPPGEQMPPGQQMPPGEGVPPGQQMPPGEQIPPGEEGQTDPGEVSSI